MVLAALRVHCTSLDVADRMSIETSPTLIEAHFTFSFRPSRVEGSLTALLESHFLRPGLFHLRLSRNQNSQTDDSKVLD